MSTNSEYWHWNLNSINKHKLRKLYIIGKAHRPCTFVLVVDLSASWSCNNNSLRLICLFCDRGRRLSRLVIHWNLLLLDLAASLPLGFAGRPPGALHADWRL